LVVPSPQLRHSNILTRPQKSDPIFSVGVEVISTVFNMEPKYGVTMLTKKEWTRVPVTLRLKSSSGLQMGPGLRRDWRWGLCAICRKKIQHLTRKPATIFQALVYAILA
jgi:hypothetical protein